MRIFLLAVFLLAIFVPGIKAEEIEIKPKVLKHATEVLFDKRKEFASRELIIKFNSNVSSEKKSRIIKREHLRGISDLNTGDFTLVATANNEKLISTAERLLKYREVEYVEPNYQVETTFTPSDPEFSKQWYLRKIQMPRAWDLNKGSSNITVAVIDAGVQTNHPDLKGKIVSPYDVVRGRKTIIPDEHGTHVAGIIAATINKTGIAGIAPNVKIMPVNVFDQYGADIFDVAEGIYYAVNHKADILNLSLGSFNYSYALDYAINYARSKGVTIVAAAGNDDTSAYTYPAALPSVLGISATDNNDQITHFSNYGSYIDFAAPGMDIYSTLSGSTYGYMSGTSMAAPVVSGVAGLILSKNPLLTPGQVENILKKSSVDLGSQGWDYLYGNGRVDAYRAVTITPYPVHSFSVSKPAFTINAVNKNLITAYVQGGTSVSIFVQNSKGSTVKKLITNKKWAGGNITAVWDGRMDNGIFAPSGTYRIIVKVANGRKIVSRSASIKATNKAVPSIQVPATVSFSPPVKGKLSLPYQLNMNAKVTAVIYDRKNKEVRRLLNNTTVASGKRTLVWDGKTSKGKKVSDGKYTLVMSVIDSRKVKGATKKVTVTVDSIKPSGKIGLYSSLMKIDGKVKSGTKLDFKEAVYVNAYVTTEKGSRVKKLAAEKIFKRGISTLYWDGKNDKGQYVAEGKYKFYAEYRDAAGNKQSMKSSVFTLQDWTKPSVTATPSFVYRTKTNTPVTYRIGKQGDVTITILKDNKIIRTIQSNAYKVKGSYKFNFDGKDQNGSYLNDGKYQYRVAIADKYKQVTHFYGNVTVALEQVKVEFPSIVQFNPWGGTEVFYSLSSPAGVTIEIFNEHNQTVRTILNNSSVPTGINSFRWDGTNDFGGDERGELYFYSIKAKHANGNETVARGKLTNQEQPAWLQSQEHSFINDGWNNKQLNLQITVAEPVTLHLKVYDSFYDENIVDQKVFQLTSGINSIEYMKLHTSNQYYLLEYQDSLGNKFQFDIEY